MSFVFEDVEDSICEKAAYNGTSKFIRASVNPAARNQIQLPIDYQYHSVFMPKKYAKWADRYSNFKVRDDDVWIVGYPKTGTTWIHNIVWRLKQNLNYSVPAKKAIDEYFDAAILFEESNGNEKFASLIEDFENKFDQFDSLPSPRIFKSHMPAFLLPKEIWTKKTKVIYITRNPKDTATSQYHMRRNAANRYMGTLNDFCEGFINDSTNFSPFIDHVFSFWQLRELEHVLFLTYEQLSFNQFEGVKRISEFLNFSHNDEQLQELTDFVSFKSMRMQKIDDSTANVHGGRQDLDFRHCRKGIVGGFRDELTAELIKRFDEWSEEKLKGTDFKFSQ